MVLFQVLTVIVMVMVIVILYAVEERQILLSKIMLLSKNAILRHIKEGNIVIEPFKEENLNSASYDVTLGPYYYREKHHQGGVVTYNPYSEKDIKRIWGKKAFKAKPLKEWSERTGIEKIENINPDDLVIWIAPGETILGHTQEFIGGRKVINTMLKARSSFGRNFIEICKDAGWGDIGYINRWTIEITNNSRYYQIPLVVGRRVGQMTFFEVEEIPEKEHYHKRGKYQKAPNIEKLKKEWRPELMLPRMFEDFEIEQ